MELQNHLRRLSLFDINCYWLSGVLAVSLAISRVQGNEYKHFCIGIGESVGQKNEMSGELFSD